MRTSIVVCLIFLAGCSQAPAEPPLVIDDVLRLTGTVLDPLFRPIEGALVQVIGNTTIDTLTDTEGRFIVEVPRQEGLLVTASADGYAPVTRSAQATLDLVLQPVSVGYHDTQSFDGLIACGFVVQVEHSHGNGDPEDDNHITCPDLAENRVVFDLRPENDPDDMMIELFWTPNSHYADQMIIAVYDDQGELINFAEGDSPVRLDLAAVLVQDAFNDGRGGTIKVFPGIPSSAPGDVFIGAHIDQRFTVFATSFHGMVGPATFTVDQ